MTVPILPIASPPDLVAPFTLPASISPLSPTSPTSPSVTAGTDVSSGPLLPAAMTCANCLAPLGGDYCAGCGAPSLEQRPLTVRRFAGDLWTELTSVDSATVRSLRTLVLEPGRLTLEYLRGRTRWYVSPLRLFLMTTTVLVFVSVVSGYQQRMADTMRAKAETQQRISAQIHKVPPPRVATPIPAAARKPLTARKLRQRAIFRRFKPEMMMAALLDTIGAISTNPWLQIGNPLAVAAALALVLRRKRQNYAEHFVHALHFMAFSSLLSAAIVPVRELQGGETSFFSPLLLLYWLVAGRYFYLSVRRLYADSNARALVDTALFAVSAQSAMMVLPFVAALATVIWLIVSLLVRVLLA